MIELINCDFGYDSALFTAGNVRLEKGKLYALAGANGSGKTTILQTLNLEIKPLNGDAKILIDGEKLSGFSLKAKSRKITFVPSKFDGVAFLSVYNFLLLGRTPFLNALSNIGTEDREIVEEIIKLLGIDRLRNKNTNEISDGERQICCIAKALVQECDYILLDEPTAFLDYKNRMKILALLQAIAVDRNKCVIMSNHDLDLLLTSNTELLLLDRTSKTIRQFKSGEISKAEILSLAFPD